MALILMFLVYAELKILKSGIWIGLSVVIISNLQTYKGNKR